MCFYTSNRTFHAMLIHCKYFFQNSSGSVVTTVMLQQGQNFTFRMRPTFPVTFAHCFSSSIPCYPYHQFQLNATSQKAYDCSFILSSGANTSVPITVTPTTVKIMKRNIIGRIEFLNVDILWSTIFQNYKIQGIQVCSPNKILFQI